MKNDEALEFLKRIFPSLSESNGSVTSEPTSDYNCIAWAGHDATSWWWPTDGGYWPSGAPRSETAEAFVAAYATLGYSRCTDAEPEVGFEKVAIYLDRDGVPTHAARSIDDTRWTSKLGELHDISHTLHALDGKSYGSPSIFLRRQRAAAEK